MIYVIGGMNLDDGLLSECEKYSLERDTWIDIRDMNVPLKNASVCALTSDSLYVFGGTNNLGIMVDII